MTVTVPALRRWEPQMLPAAAAAAATGAADLGQAAAALVRAGAVVATWEGSSATEASNRRTGLGSSIAGLAQVFSILERALRAGTDLAEQTVRLLALAEMEAAAQGLTITAGGAVTDPAGLGAPGALHVESLVARAVTLAGEADRALAAAIRSAGHVIPRRLDAISAQVARPGPPPSDASASSVRSWWSVLSADQRAAVVTDYPDLVGSTDGLPGWARDRANRILLDRDEVALAAREAMLRPAPDGVLGGLAGAATIGTLGGGARRVEYAQVVAKLEVIRAVRQVLAVRDGQERQLLALDLTGRSGKVAVAVGDVDTASHVAVLVPGFTTSVGRDLMGADAAAASLTRLSDRVAMGWGDRASVASVTWMGYDAPQVSDTLTSTHSVVLRSSAEAGADSLVPFLAGLGVGRHVTLVGHSYGSTVAGVAVARGGTGVDDLVVMGSPGLGVGSVNALGMPAARVHVIEADDDPVADLGWFGGDPDRMVGVDVLSAGAGVAADGSAAVPSHGHSEYLVPGTTSQWNIAAVVAGVPSRGVRVGQRAG